MDVNNSFLKAAYQQVRQLPLSVQIIALLLTVIVAYAIVAYATRQRPYPQFPVIDLKKEEGLGPMISWFKRGEKVIAKGRKTTNGTFQVITGTGPKLLVPNRFAHELRNNEALNFQEATATEFFPTWPGFEAFRAGLHSDNIITEVVRVKLTQSLNLVTEDLVDETDDSSRLIFPPSKEWNNVKFKQAVLEMVARLSSRVFLGQELCRNQRWLEIAKDYTVDSFVAAMKLRFTPVPLRPLGLLVYKECWAIRKEYADATKLITKEVEMRKERVQKALDAGQKPPKTADTIGWMHEICQRKGTKTDLVAAQLSLSLAAIHTTTESLLYLLMDICKHPEVVKPLREEMVSVLRENGWSKTTLYKMKLVDSFLKESQRINTLSDYTMSRACERDIELSDGTVLPKGSRINVLTAFMDPEIYEDPHMFKADRFLQKRAVAGQENGWQHVTTSPEHLGFGHGQHACPGRFFATNELKIALCFMLLRYDFKLSNFGGDQSSFEGRRIIPQDFELQYKSREPELDLMSLSFV
ncbi:hypothetical protein AMS68_007675 [Peltaster fructicola]|uniref:Cytochrome P450 monooxygenase n=1 Tax=Peltaster fructicola TaxID=286661 RepID=A0A6H0Y5P3_9PEZI|nr:hypothetical protein AMS68_007675 [Peltaster fructicola]